MEELRNARRLLAALFVRAFGEPARLRRHHPPAALRPALLELLVRPGAAAAAAGRRVAMRGSDRTPAALEEGCTRNVARLPPGEVVESFFFAARESHLSFSVASQAAAAQLITSLPSDTLAGTRSDQSGNMNLFAPCPPSPGVGHIAAHTHSVLTLRIAAY
eukprot:CAMPEP_0119358440 /NCGR_PEP_ID=MMETSP1334-20130426/6657_1 /TAXON_ID=127549 /ORGANISM="Calcidiscus leptoporus, Strain RCC1130" /LENGTH=160 /DNA_ID=CAMNT_0007372947 /DNA_START=361 /DNA_END=841 /DNA_ORIENTATION=-